MARKDKLVLSFDTTRKSFFKEFLELLKPVIEKMLSEERLRLYPGHRFKSGRGVRNDTVLHGKEMETLAMLMYYNDKFSDVDEEFRKKIVLDYDTKMRIRSETKNSSYAHANNIASLRKKLALIDKITGVEKGKLLHPFLDILPEDKFYVILEFDMTGEKENDKPK